MSPLIDPSDLLIEFEGNDGPLTSERIGGRTRIVIGPVEVSLEASEDNLSWSVSNLSSEPLIARSLALVLRLPAGERVRMFCNGYQSWSRSGVLVVGEDADPTRHPDSIFLARETLQSDPRRALLGEIRSDLVTVVDAGLRGPLLRLGFDGGSSHDGIFRTTRGEGVLEMRATAHLGGAELAPGEERRLHGISWSYGADASSLLEEWSEDLGRRCHARNSSPYQTGWCSWYHYFHGIHEGAIRSNLALAGDFPVEVFQIDDGFQSDVGDWLTTNEKFGSSLDEIAASISDRGLTPGIWIAPFLASPSSELAAGRPELLARLADQDTPLIGGFNPGWGGIVYSLDTTRSDTLEHLERLASELVERGFRYLKLDFTYAPSVSGRYSDPSKTPAQRVRAGLEAIRRGAGDDVFLLGCGCPLGPAVGVVDGMRIGPDVAPWWGPEGNAFISPGFDEEAPAISNAWRNTLTRSFMHRKLWLNDPDCLMLRTTSTMLTERAARAWALAVAASGGMALISDDLSLVPPKGKRLFDEVIELGRRVDRASVETHPPRCVDLMDSHTPSTLSSSVARLVGSATDQTAEIAGPLSARTGSI